MTLAVLGDAAAEPQAELAAISSDAAITTPSSGPNALRTRVRAGPEGLLAGCQRLEMSRSSWL